VALLLVFAGLAAGQQPVPATTSTATFDVSFRASDIEGDGARFQRFQDLRKTGAGLDFTLERQGPSWLVTARGLNVGYRDQEFGLAARTGKLRVSFEWNQVPLFASASTVTPYLESSPGVFTLDSAARQSVQNGKAIGIPFTPAAAQSASIFRGLSQPFDLRSRRDTATFRLAYAATRDLTLKVELDTYRRTGRQPWGGGFAFSILPELPLTLDNRTTNLAAGVEWANGTGMVRVGYEGSYFSNNVETLTWDNPNRATDYNQNQRTPSGYDPSGYVTGNGPARGRMALAPSSHANGVNALGMIKLPRRSTLRAGFSVVGLTQDADLIPWTINPVIADPRVYALFPNLSSLERNTAQADVRQANARATFVTRPTRSFALTAKYRFFNRDDRTPAFDGTEYVRFDAVPEDTGRVTRHLDLTRHTIDVDATFTPLAHAAFRVGVGRDRVDHARAYTRLDDTTFRASVDTVGNQYVMLRALYEHTSRSGSRFNQAALADASSQPALRWYDDANRTRNRTSAIVDVTPVPMLGLNATMFLGKDEYDGDAQQFGLRNNDNTGYSLGVSLVPDRRLTFGAVYGREKYTSLQRSRAATSTSDATWTDRGRDWSLDQDETVQTVAVNLGVIQALPKTEIRVGYDWNQSDQGFLHSGPRIDALAAIGQFVPLPGVTDRWQRATFDVRYFLAPKVGVGVGYWYSKYAVSDFQTVDLAGGAPRTDYVGSLMLGYGYRPFNANTGFVRLFYSF
jgi:MtrB/PioB family decaheme-associated outer membrane protein